MKIYSNLVFLFMTFVGCANMKYTKTVEYVELDRFMTKWYVIAGRLTFLEEGAHNAVEIYHFDENEKKINIDFSFYKNSFNGPLKKIPQTAWIVDNKSNAQWKVSPFWPLKFDYLVIALADDYSWTAIGVPNGKYLWIMSQNWNMDDDELDEILNKLKKLGYPANDVKRVPQKWQ